MPSPERPPITQSPWFWVYMFCTAALIGLMLFGNKLTRRQLAVERNFQGRQRVLEQRAGESPATGLSSEGNTALSLAPLYLLLIAGFVISWIILWWQRFRRSRRPTSEPPPQQQRPPPEDDA
jgi:hypothetical protein